MGKRRRVRTKERREKSRTLKGLRISFSSIKKRGIQQGSRTEIERGDKTEDKISETLGALKKEGKIPYFAKTKRSIKGLRWRFGKRISTKEGGLLDSEKVDFLLGLPPVHSIQDFINFLQEKRDELDKIKIKQSVNYLKKNLPNVEDSLEKLLEFLGQIEIGRWHYGRKWLIKLDWKIKEIIRFFVFIENPFFIPIQVTSSLGTLKRKLEEQKEWEKRTGQKRNIVFVYWEPTMSPQVFWEQTKQKIEGQRGGRIESC